MPVISIRSLHFKHISEAARIRDSKKKKKLICLKHQQERARHMQFTGKISDTISRSCTPEVHHHHHESTTPTNAFHDRKLCGLHLPLKGYMLYLGVHTFGTRRTGSADAQANNRKWMEWKCVNWSMYEETWKTWWKTRLPNAATYTVYPYYCYLRS